MLDHRTRPGWHDGSDVARLGGVGGRAGLVLFFWGWEEVRLTGWKGGWGVEVRGYDLDMDRSNADASE